MWLLNLTTNVRVSKSRKMLWDLKYRILWLVDDSLILSDNDDRLPLSSTCEHWISSNFSQPCCNGSTEGVGEIICIISKHTRGQNVHLYSCLSKRCSVQPSMLDLLLIIASFESLYPVWDSFSAVQWAPSAIILLNVHSGSAFDRWHLHLADFSDHPLRCRSRKYQ